jgi:hypothetical protein
MRIDINLFGAICKLCSKQIKIEFVKLKIYGKLDEMGNLRNSTGYCDILCHECSKKEEEKC